MAGLFIPGKWSWGVSRWLANSCKYCRDSCFWGQSVGKVLTDAARPRQRPWKARRAPDGSSAEALPGRPHQRLTCRHLCCLQHTPPTFDFLQLCVVPELSQPRGETPKPSAKFQEDKLLVLHTTVVFLQDNRDTNENQFFFFILVSHLQSDVLRSAGSPIKVSRGAGSCTFDVPDLRSRRQAYVLAAPRENSCDWHPNAVLSAV